MRLVVAVATWALVSSFPQGKLFRMEREESDLVALRAEGTLKAPAWAVRDVLLHGFESDKLSPYLAHRKVLHAEGCRDGARDLPGCRRVWVYERYEPPLMGARDYAFRMEVVVDDVDEWRGLRAALGDRREPRRPSGGVDAHGPQHRRLGDLAGRRRRSAGSATTSTSTRAAAFACWIVNMANKSQVPSVIAAVEDEAQKLALRRARSAARP